MSSVVAAPLRRPLAVHHQSTAMLMAASRTRASVAIKSVGIKAGGLVVPYQTTSTGWRLLGTVRSSRGGVPPTHLGSMPPCRQAGRESRHPHGAAALRTVRNKSTTTPGRRSSRRRKSTAAPFSQGAAPPRSPPQCHAHQSPPPRESTLSDLFVAFREGLHEIILRPRTVAVPRWITPKRFTVTYSECFGHLSFILVAASYATDDFLTLRCVAVAGSTTMLLFTYFHPHGRVLWLPFKWNMLFIAINAYRIGRVVIQRYWSEFMSDEMKQIHAEHFFVMDPIDFAKLARLGRREVYEPGDLIVAQNEPNRYIRLVLEGEVEVMRDGMVTYRLEEANFISETGLHAGLMLYDTVESCCSIVARRKTPEGEPAKVRTIAWDRTELMDLLDREPQLRRSINSALAWDIVRKLKGQRKMLVEGGVSDPERWTRVRKEQNEDRYAAILSNVLQHPNYRTSFKDELNKYRIIHHIDDEKHALALERCGWTPEEFKLGRKLRSSVDDEDDDESDEDVGQNWKWRIQSILSRVLG